MGLLKVPEAVASYALYLPDRCPNDEFRYRNLYMKPRQKNVDC